MSNFFLNLNKLNDSFLAIWVLDKNLNFVDLNKKTEEFLGYKKEELLGKSMASIRPKHNIEQHITDSWKEVEKKGFWQGVSMSRKKNGEIVAMKRVVFKKRTKEGEKFYISLSSEMNEMDEEFKGSLIDNDYVTGFISKQLFIESLDKLTKKDKEEGKKTVLLSLDTNRLVSITEALGFEARDEYIKQVGKRVAKLLDKYGFISRFAGDQFNVVLLKEQNQEKLVALLNKIIEHFKVPFQIQGQEYKANVNIGVCFYPDNGETVQELIKNCRLAKNQAKEEGGNLFRFFTPKLNEDFTHHLIFENEIQEGLKKNQFKLYYQPQYLVKENKIGGFEALIRWEHPTKGLLTPNRFIPFAEQSGLIVEIGKWILKEAMLQIKKWQDKGYNFPMDVNLSAKELENKDIVHYIKELIEETEIDPKLFGIELTESVMINNVSQVSEAVKELEKLGIEVGIDDFGTGHSALSSLIEIPLRFIKIDRSFLFDIGNRKNKAIISLSLSLAKELGLVVIAEGVETKEHVDYLIEQGCHYLQGYYFSKPIPIEEIEENIEQYLTEWFKETKE